MTTCPIDGAEMAPGATICRGCLNNLRLDLGEVPEMLDQLDLTLSRQDTRTSGGISDPEAPPVDYDEDAGTVAAEIRRVLTVAGREWLKTADLSPERLPAVERLYPTIRGKAALLASTPGLGAKPWAPKLATEIGAAIKAGRVAIDSAGSTRFVGACPGIEHEGRGPAMYAAEGSATAKCRACGQIWDVEASRAALVAAIPTHADKLLTATQIAVLLGVAVGTIHRWASERRIVAVDPSEKRPRYWVQPIAEAVRSGIPPAKIQAPKKLKRLPVASQARPTPPEGVTCPT